jgi:membrane-associated protease RseP (regulator of RpoE activity)
MSFITYDIIFLVLFTLFVVIFLYKHKHNLKREGILYLYKTKVGIKFIEWTDKKYGKILKKLQYVIIASGYLLMFFGLWFIIKATYIYLTSPYMAQALKVPIITPLVPYITNLFNISFLPPFYFTYWIIIIAAIAIPHEFAHGIFARLNKIKILSTGFGFLGPFLAAFVEQDDKQMQKSKKFSQLSVLAAGTFANVLMTIVFGLILLLFFVAAFSPAGVNFNTYTLDLVNASAITAISSTYFDNSTLLEVKANNTTYFADEQMVNYSLSNNASYMIVYDDSPALRAKLSGTIVEIDGKKITSYSDMNITFNTHKPGDNITITTINADSKNKTTYDITLAEKDGKAFLGIGFLAQERTGFFAVFYNLLDKIKDPFIYYQSRLGELGIFIFNLFWWAVMISLSVALVNMLPLGIFDGGRFFFLTIWAITKRQKIAENAFKISTWFLLFLIFAMLIKWFMVFL